jgi:uncharacterized membrane protein
MREHKTNADRIAAFSDAVIAVIITVMVLELTAPDEATIPALLPLWPTAISYAVSYLFIAIIWHNHHHLLRFVGHATPALIWVNFAHLFWVSLVPFATAWIARTRLASGPVATYAAIFVCVNIAYLLFERLALAQADPTEISGRARRMAKRRSFATLSIFSSAIVLPVFAPRLRFDLLRLAALPDTRGARHAAVGAGPQRVMPWHGKQPGAGLRGIRAITSYGAAEKLPDPQGEAP